MVKLETVKIEAGKFYRTREGEKVGPMRKYDGDSWSDERLSRLWKDDGSRYYGDLDGVIISEWAEAPKFKVGDRVRFTDQTPQSWWVKPGMEGVVTEVVGGSGFHVRIDNRGVAGTTDRYIELIPDTPSFTLDWPHGHVTRDGRKARIVCTDARGPYPIVALIEAGNSEWLRRHALDGACQLRCYDLDLLNAPAPKSEWWVNVYADGKVFAHTTKEKAEYSSEGDKSRIACVHVTEGDGL